MHIVHIHSENVKRLKVVDFSPDPTMQVVSGRNGQGKSSLLDSIFMALGGKEAIPGKPVRDGCDKAVVRLNLGELLVERKFTAAGGTSLSITNNDGLVYKSPQTMLDALLGELTFDPLAFARSKASEQLASLRQIVKLPIDLDALDAANKIDYDARTQLNREAKQKRAQADAIKISPDAPAERIDESIFLDQIERAANHNADVERRRGNRTKAASEIAANRRQAADLRTSGVEQILSRAEEKIAELKRQIRTIEEEAQVEADKARSTADALDFTANTLEAQLKSAGELPALLSVSELRQSLDAAKIANADYGSRNRKRAIEEEATLIEIAAMERSKAIEERERTKTGTIKAAKMPVEGIGFGEGCVTLNGIPFDQASSAEQLRVSVAIAMSANPKLKIIRIKEGGLLDSDNLALIAEMARERGYQVWLEAVNPAGDVGIVMENGEIRA